MAYEKALVTGGAGFIGSHVVDRLLAEGLTVAVVDDLSSGRRSNLNIEASFHQLDLRSPKLIDVFRSERPQVVFHLAAQSSVAISVRTPAEDAQINILGAINMLEGAQAAGTDRIIYSSTGGALYGEPERLPCDEAHSVRPLSPYGASKYSVEAYLHTYRASSGVKNTILRYGNVYGPRQDPHGEAGVVAIFANLMLNDEEAVIFGDGLQERDMVYVGDVVEATFQALLQAPDDIFNIGTGKPTNVNQIFEQLAKLTGYQRAAKHGPPRAGDVYKIYLDVRHAQERLGWVAKVGMEEGLERTVRSIRDNASA